MLDVGKIKKMLFLAKLLSFKFLDFVEKLYEFERYAVLERKWFYRDFRFYNFRLKRDEAHEIEKVSGWDFIASTVKNSSHLSYSQRCQYLN